LKETRGSRKILIDDLFCSAVSQLYKAKPSLNQLMHFVHESAFLRERPQSPSEELANSISHGIGLIAGLIGTPILLLTAFAKDSGLFVGTIVFTITMLTLYFLSMLYHAWPPTSGKYVLQVFDHSAVFLLIAGTYTPFALGPLRGSLGSTMLGWIWAIAIFGVIIKITRGTARHRKLAMALYLGMGWSALLVARPIVSLLPASAVIWMLAGGIAYTIGVLFYIQERLRYGHLVWHLLVLTGTSCHFLALLSCAA
jgi:hemolysin III